MYILYDWFFITTIRDMIPEMSVFSIIPLTLGFIELALEVFLIWFIMWVYKKK